MALLASAVNDSMVRDLFAAGLIWIKVSHVLVYFLPRWESLRIDNADHSILAMFALAAVVPDRFGIIDLYGV